MKKMRMNQILPVALFFALAAITGYSLLTWNGVSVPAMARPARFEGTVLVIDAGHGGEDGGAVSPAGNVESKVNLSVARKMDGILGLFGVDVVMLRTEDVSLHDSDAATLRQKKVSDLHNRVAAIEATPNATLVSIHQNSYGGSAKYHGAQVFYANAASSLPFAQVTQETLRLALDHGNMRKAAKIPDTVYLMKHVTCRAILVECGFLTNSAEDALLQTSGYQTKVAAALAGAYLRYAETDLEGETPDEGENSVFLHGVRK